MIQRGETQPPRVLLTPTPRVEAACELSTEPRAYGLTTEVVTDVERIRSLQFDYAHLNRVTSNTLPFALHEWHLAWCDHFLNRGTLAQYQPLFCVLRDLAQGCVGIVPLIVTRRRLGPLPFVTVSLLGADPGLTEIRAPVIQPGYETAAVRAVHEALARVPSWDLMLWSGLSEPMVAALAREAAPQWCGINEDFVLDLPASWEEFRSQLSRNVRESLRHCYNSLKRDRHEFEFVVAKTPEEVRRALPRFLELHAMRAAMPWGPRHPDRFASPSLRAFICDVCERLAVRDAVRIFQLKIAGEVVASRIGFVVADSLYLYYSGFDPAWARYSVMTTTLAEALKFAIANGIRTANLSPTPERSKLRWRPRRVDLKSALINGAPLRSRVAGMAYRVAQSSNSAPIRLLRGFFWTHHTWK